MSRDRWDPVGDIIIPTIAYYKLGNKLQQILSLVCFILLYKTHHVLSESGLMTSVFEGSKDADEQPWKNIPFMSAGALSINFNVLF